MTSRVLCGVLSVAVFAALVATPGQGGSPIESSIPAPLKAEHDELHAELASASAAGGRIGEAARAVAKLLHPHFVKEEEFALPPLGLLPRLSRGEVTPDMQSVLVMTDRLKRELPEMLREHQAIVGALNDLVSAAEAEGKMEYAHFAEKLKQHAQSEEAVLYPSAILVGEYVKLRLNP